MEKLKDKHVLVVGASGGIGEQTVKQLTQSGAIVYATSRDLNRLETFTSKYGLPVPRQFEMDITSSQNIHDIANKIHLNIPAIDILVNAAGIGIIKPFEQLTDADFRKSIDVNLIGAFNLLQAFLPAMKVQKKGLIINIPGVLGKTPMAGAAAYAASKYGLNGMMKSLREELKRTDIRITQLFLGGVDSTFWDTIDLRVQRDKMILAEEAAKAIWFLCQQPISGVVSEMVIQPFNHQVI